MAFPPLLVQYCCGCISLGVSFPSELQRQKLTLGGKEEGVLPGHTPLPHPLPLSGALPPPRLPSCLSGFLPCGVGLTGGNFVGSPCSAVGGSLPHYFLILSAPKVEPQIFPLWSSGWPCEPKVGSGTHVGYLMMALIAQRSHIRLRCFLLRPC